MKASFSFEVDPRTNLVRITMAGLFTLGDVAAFVEERRKAHNRLWCAPNAHLTLADMRGMKIQLQEVVAAFQDVLAAPEYRSRRLAFVVGQTLARSQLMRALSTREAECFEDMAAAEAWLFGEADDLPEKCRASA